MKKQQFTAALFDLDGTVLDVKNYLLQAYRHTIKFHLGRHVIWKEVAVVLGAHLKECYQRLTGLENVDQLMVDHDAFQYQHLDLITAYPRAKATLAALKTRNVAIAAVTNRYGDQVKQSLQLTGLDQYFEVVVTPLEVTNCKPDAEPVVKALEHLGVAADRAILIGDSPHDILAGKNAKVKTIGALYGFHGQRLLESKPDYTVNDIEQILPLILGI